jgi:hypothetical protein
MSRRIIVTEICCSCASGGPCAVVRRVGVLLPLGSVPLLVHSTPVNQ